MTRRILTLLGSAALMLALAVGVAVAFNAINCPNASNNRCFGTAGEDQLDGSGETANQLIDAGASDDTALGGTGNDTMFGRKGADGELSGSNLEFDGGDGNDSIDVGPGNDHEADGDEGNDTIQGGDGNDGDRNADGSCDFGDSLRGEGGKNIVGGGAGNDCIDADTSSGSGGDEEQIFGGTGNDFIVADDGVKDTISCGDGSDIVFHDSEDVVNANCEVKNPSSSQSVADNPEDDDV